MIGEVNRRMTKRSKKDFLLDTSHFQIGSATVWKCRLLLYCTHDEVDSSMLDYSTRNRLRTNIGYGRIVVLYYVIICLLCLISKVLIGRSNVKYVFEQDRFENALTKTKIQQRCAFMGVSRAIVVNRIEK